VDDAISLDLREMQDAPSAENSDAVILGVLRHENALVAIVDADALINACQAAALLEVA
jgi:chemotaxis signal transduction protein